MYLNFSRYNFIKITIIIRNSKAQLSELELLKASRNPLRVIDDLYKEALEGIPLKDEYIGLLKWYGMYPHINKDGLEDKKYDSYYIYFDESISGLNIGSPIKYKGFDVGLVKYIKISPHNSEKIEVEIQIQKGTPIKDDNYAILGNLGITGLKYVGLKRWK